MHPDLPQIVILTNGTAADHNDLPAAPTLAVAWQETNCNYAVSQRMAKRPAAGMALLARAREISSPPAVLSLL
ncbi:MAG: hypothetical protein J2P49_03530 [Methylocapsa sp.]|nr:hypothetical protein [Methylocapsa sp.]